MFHSYKIKGIVIKRINFGEADKILTIFTKKRGKIVVLAKGIRKIKSRKAPHLEVFNNVSSYIACGKTFDIVTEASTIDAFPFLRFKLNLLAFAYRIVEEIDRLCPERQEYRNIYKLLISTLKQLNTHCHPDQLVEEFTLNLLYELGYLPRGKIVTGETLDRFVENVMERRLKSNSLLRKV